LKKEGVTDGFYPFKIDTIGIRPKAKLVGIAVLRHIKEASLSFMKEYRKKVPKARAINMNASNNPKKRSPIPNFASKLCLLKL
jgi:hypothetical protein